MKVLFVLPDVRPELIMHNGSVFEGVAYLSAALKEAGHSVAKYQPLKPVSHEKLLEVVERERPGLIAYSAVTNMFKYVARWAPHVKRAFPDIPAICGGVHATGATEGVIATEGIDMACVGEGEFAIRELCDRLEKEEPYTDIPSLWVNKDGGCVKNPVAPLPPTLDNYPFPDLDLFEIEKTFYYKNRFATLKLSRGCPLPCAYCCNRMFMDIYPSEYVRYRDPENSIAYVKTFLEKYPNVDALAFLDDILPMKKDWFRAFCELYKKEVGLPYTARCLVNIFNDEVARLLADSGCYEVTFGVEAGSESFRKDVLKRRQSNKKITEAFRLCEKHGMVTRANMMVGLPYETPDNVLEGVELCSKLNAKYFIVSTFFPTPATELHDICVKEGYIDPNEEPPDSPYNMGSALEQPSIKAEQVEFYRAWYTGLVRFYTYTPGTLHPLWLKILASSLFPFRLGVRLAKVRDKISKVLWRVLLAMGVKHRRYRA